MASAQQSPRLAPSSAERMKAATQYLRRTLNANINPAFTPNNNQRSESHRRYRYAEEKLVSDEKTHNLRKDEMKTYVEKALALHDERGGMPVVLADLLGLQ